MKATRIVKPIAAKHMGPRGAQHTAGLPVFSTETKYQAKFLVVTHCKLARDGSGIYTLDQPPPRSLDELDGISELFATTRTRMIELGKWNDLK